MKSKFCLLICLLGWILPASGGEKEIIRISTRNIDLIYKIAGNGRVYQQYIGKRLQFESDFKHLPSGKEIYLTHGMEDYYEPAIRILHNDGNPSLLLKYAGHQLSKNEDGSTATVIRLRDEAYPVEVDLHYISYPEQDVIKTYAEIRHHEKKPVTLYNYASSLLHFAGKAYYLTEFTGNWAHEVNMTESQLSYGKKVLDTKLGSRANMFCSPFFVLSFGQPAAEDEGEVLLGTLGWTGNYRFTFEQDHQNHLRVLSGINPYASEYELKPDETFTTPEFIFTYSLSGKGTASRHFHDWARKYQLKEGMGDRMTLLNNWEATYFNFDEQKLSDIMDEAVKLGVDMFLLDDGWFGNKYPRSSDHQGLGDWEETKDKLPHGIGYLVKTATDKGIKFGLWIEPEMVNPKSVLYEKHRDWVIRLPNREEYYFRNQLVLDLSNPDVQDYVFGVVDDLMTKYPGIAYFKWDCNSPITNIYSAYLKNKQTHLYIGHVRGLYRILDRIKAKYPNLPMMLCSGGGGRSDYEALKYFTEFWPSDNTDPIERIFIQWGFSHFFPVKSMAAHVTGWGKQPLKFRLDVAMMCKLGFDIRTQQMTEKELSLCHQAVSDFNRLKPVILEGDQYRLVSPYETDHAAFLYTAKKQDRGVLFIYNLHPRYASPLNNVRLKGLKADAFYRLDELNVPEGQRKSAVSGKVYSGDYLMSVGLSVLSNRHTSSSVFELVEEKRNIEPGALWKDTKGQMINAHGGGILYHEGTYYWYGELKGDSTYWNPNVPNWECYRTEAGGISCYSSKDLYNWTFEGVVLKPDLTDRTSDLHPSNVLERPKVIYNEKTKKFVMWLHVDSDDYSKACAGVAVCDTPAGEFKYIRSMRPNQSMSRDMTLFKDDDGKAYLLYSSEGNATLHISLLTDDYLDHTGTFTRNFERKSREAPAVFKRKGKYYMITSGCTGWSPNKAMYAVADSVLGPWTLKSNPCRGKDAEKTFYGQSTHVLPVAGKEDTYIAMFDRWMKKDLINSRYIWLPIRFETEELVIEWKDSWIIENNCETKVSTFNTATSGK